MAVPTGVETLPEGHCRFAYGEPQFRRNGFDLPLTTNIILIIIVNDNINYGGPNGSRTRVAAVKGRRPRPLDDETIVN